MTRNPIEKPTLPTADICDQITGAEWIKGTFGDYGKISHFCGPAVTIKTNNDNSMVKKLLCSPGAGRVLVVDNGGDLDRAMVGGNLARWGAENDWCAIIISGAVRDRHELQHETIAVKALGTCPKKSDKGSAESHLEAVTIGGVTVNTGDWVTGDMDGIVITKAQPDLA